MEIDWVKVPTATHFDPSSGLFYRASDIVFRWEYLNENDEWVQSRDWHGRTSAPESAIPRPDPWKGEGLPPVGAVCEYQVGGGTWFECEIRYVLDTGSFGTKNVVIYAKHLRGEQVAKVGGGAGEVQFRPIRTAEQIAEQAHREAVEELAAATDWILTREACEAVLAAGYRKQVQP